MTSTAKDTIYIDIDDEITSIIEKVQDADAKIAALVLPKRAAMLQSIVNMKLLKRAADDAGKNIVLITSEAGILPLAGAVGLYTAKTLQTKPTIPAGPISIHDGSEEAAEDVEIDQTKPIGALAGLPDDSDEEIDVDDEPAVDTPEEPAKKSKNKKLQVPNFNKFRLRLILGAVLLILIITGWYFANYVWPAADIIIKTNTSSVTSDLTFTAREGLAEPNLEKSLIGSSNEELRKTDTEKAPATGQKNLGKKAGGEVTFSTDCAPDFPTIPEGTGISANNLTFITQDSVTLFAAPPGPDGCKFTGTVEVIAQNPGGQYNLGARSYTVSGFSNISAEGSDMSGGTDKNVKIIAQSDVDAAQKKISDRNTAEAKKELTTKLEQSGYLPLPETFKASKPSLTASPNVGSEGSEVTVSSTVIYTMTGLKKDHLEKLIEKDIGKEIDTTKQSITDMGLADAVFRILKKTGADTQISLQTIVVAGPQLDGEAIKKAVAGLKKGDTIATIQKRPGIQEVTVEYTPFWVFTTPKRLDKITVTFENTNTEIQSEQ